MLPLDGHVHTQFSWDASRGDMAATCARAAAIGLTSLAFTEHVDLAPSTKSWDALPEHVRGHLGEGGRFLADPLDVEAYLAEVAVMAASDAPFEVLGHVDHPLRHWPTGAGPDPVGGVRGRRPPRPRCARRVRNGDGGEHPAADERGLRPLVARRRRRGPGLRQRCPPPRGPGARRHRDRPEDLAHGFRPGATPYEHWGRA